MSRAVLSVWVLMLLTACGFQPRGSVVQISTLGSVFVDADRDLSIRDEVRSALQDASLTLAGNRDEADTILRLINELQTERVVSVTSNGRVSELELGHSVDMRLQKSGSETNSTLFNTVVVNREYTYDETGILGKGNEARILRQEMKRDLVRQIVLRSITRLTPSASVLGEQNTATP